MTLTDPDWTWPEPAAGQTRRSLGWAPRGAGKTWVMGELAALDRGTTRIICDPTYLVGGHLNQRLPFKVDIGDQTFDVVAVGDLYIDVVPHDPDVRDDGRHGPTVMLAAALIIAACVAVIAASVAIILATP